MNSGLAVLAVLHQRVSLDLAQVASRALLPPSETQLILDGYVTSGRVRVEGGRYVLAPASVLADWFAAMCDQSETESHECDSLIAAHDVARMIRENSFPPSGEQASVPDLDLQGRMLDLPAPDPRVSHLHMQAVADVLAGWESTDEAEAAHGDAATELRNAIAAACTCRALPHSRRCLSRSAAPRVRERVMPEPSAEQAHPTSHAIPTPRRPAMTAIQHAPNCTHSCDYDDNPQDLHDPACTHSCAADTLVAPPSGTVERPMPVDSCAVIGARHLCDGTDHRRVPTRDQVKRSLTEHVRFISAAISGSYPGDLDPEAHMWRRVMKVAEEVGEVTQALLGYLGENQRKGQTHTLDDLRTELLDVALAALGAVSHLGGDDDDTVAQLTERAAFVDDRLLSAMVARGRDEGWLDADV